MTARRLGALISAAEYGLDEREYDVVRETGVSLSAATRQDVHDKINEYLRATPPRERMYTGEELREMADQHRAAREAIDVFAYMREKRAVWYENKRKRKAAKS